MTLTEINKQRMNTFVVSAFPVLLFILFFTNSFAKVVASVASSLCLLLFLFRLFVLKNAAFQKKARNYYIIMLLYFAALAISLLYTPDLADGVQRFQGQITKLLMAVILIETVSSAVDARKLLYADLAGGTVLSIMVIYQGIVKHIERPGGIWISVHGGILLAFSALLALIVLIYEKEALRRALYALLLCIHGCALYLNGTRGAWLAFGGSLIVLPLVTSVIKPKAKIVYYVMLALVVAALLQTSYFQTKIGRTITDARQSLTVRTETSLGGRYEMWKASTRMFIDNPVFGVGLGGWGISIQEMVKRNYVSSEVLNYNQTHSIYFDVLGTRGILGFITFMVLIGYPVFFVWRKRDRNTEMFRTLVIIITTAFLLAGLTDTLVYIRGVFLAYIILIGVSLAVLIHQPLADRT